MFIVTLAGNIGKDPETRFTSSGQKVTSFSLAVNQRKGKEDVTIWVRITIWGDRFDKIISYLKKGSGVIVTGKMTPPTSYQDKEGRTQFSLEVVAEMIEFSPFGRSDKQGDGQASQSTSHGQTQAGGSQYDDNQYQMNQPGQYNKPSPYGSHGSTQSGQHMHSIDEDALPF